MVSLQQTPPHDVLAIKRFRSDSLFVNRYIASGLALQLKSNSLPLTFYKSRHIYLALINSMASKAFSILMIGKIGPKISSCITGDVS